jgi:hypothetical protein
MIAEQHDGKGENNRLDRQDEDDVGRELSQEDGARIGRAQRERLQAVALALDQKGILEAEDGGERQGDPDQPRPDVLEPQVQLLELEGEAEDQLHQDGEEEGRREALPGAQLQPEILAADQKHRRGGHGG